MVIHFTLKRKGWGYDDVYEVLKSGEKDIEWRPASDFWISRLFKDKKYVTDTIENFSRIESEGMTCSFPKQIWKATKAKFVVGYTKYPRLYADIEEIKYYPNTEQFGIKISNVIEERMSKCIYCGEWIPLGSYMCDYCYWQEREG